MKDKAKKLRSLIASLVIAAISVGQFGAMTEPDDAALKATASFTGDEAVTPDTPIRVSLSRALAANEKVAVIIGETDVTGLFGNIKNEFVYDAKLLPIPVGKSELKVYVVTNAGQWKEISRLPLLVREAAPPTPATAAETPADVPVKPNTDAAASEAAEKPAEAKIPDASATEAKPAEKAAEPAAETTSAATASETPKTESGRLFKFLPTFTISMESQPFQSNFPVESRPEKRATFNDFNLTGSIKTEGKVGNVTQESNFDFAGATFKEKTLQFGTLGREAPDVDLSSYLMNLKIGKAKFSLGHTGFGSNRHLVNSFSSRGVSINIPINKHFDVTGGILNGTSVLGVGNFLGVAKVRHQMQGATLGIEFFPKRQNAMRLEITGFNGYLQALNGVSEGQVVDAERSRGIGLRFITSDKTERFKIEAGYSLSRFFNPKDTTLDPNGTAVPLPATLRSAFYVESSNQVLKDIKVTKTKNLNLSIAFKLEYVEPLYRSLGASASADKVTHEYALDGSIGEITFQAGHARANDNLRNVPSILKLLTRANRFSVALPVTALIGASEKPSPLLPRVGYSIDQTHNYGAGIPVNGGFEIDPSTIPDLVNTNQTANSTWQFKKFNFGYTYSRSYADNRQQGSENKDQLGWVHGLTVGLNPLEKLGFNVGYSLDSQTNFELSQINRTKTLNLGTTWQPFKGATFTGELAQTLAGDAAKTSLARNVNYSGQFAYTFTREKTGFQKFGTQVFARFADAYTRRNTFGLEVSNQLTRTKIMTAGMTFNFF